MENTAEVLRERLDLLGFGPVKETDEHSKPEDFFNAMRLKNRKRFGILIINKQIVEIELKDNIGLEDLLYIVNSLLCANIPSENPQ